MKRMLIDLSELKDLYRGLGQVALAYGEYFKNHYRKSQSDYKITLLMPKEMFGMFGEEVSYLDSKHPLRILHRWFFPQFDIWHSTHQLSRFKPPFLRSAKTKVILTIHDLNYLYETQGARRRRKHARLQRKVHRADMLICISQFVKQEVERNLELNGKGCRVIYNGVTDISLEPSSKPKTDIKKPFFFSIGVFRRKKNFHVLLDMMKLMPDKQLYLAGIATTDYGEYIQSRIRDEGVHNVHVLGSVSAKEKVWLFSHCEAFLFPSLFEGFGLPVIEAMQFGKPVFSSKETSLKEIGGEFAYFWDSFNAEEMKSLIEESLDVFYSDEKLQSDMKEYAFSFTYEKHFEQYGKIYKNL